MRIDIDEVWVPSIAARLVQEGLRFKVDLIYDKDGAATGRVTFEIDAADSVVKATMKHRLHSGDFKPFEILPRLED